MSEKETHYSRLSSFLLLALLVLVVGLAVAFAVGLTNQRVSDTREEGRLREELLQVQIAALASQVESLGGKPIVGPPGEPGESITGPIGPRGLSGPRGEMGPRGREGPRGPRGRVGPEGPTGATGATGATGPQGPEGEEGENGDRPESWRFEFTDQFGETHRYECRDDEQSPGGAGDGEYGCTEEEE